MERQRQLERRRRRPAQLHGDLVRSRELVDTGAGFFLVRGGNEPGTLRRHVHAVAAQSGAARRRRTARLRMEPELWLRRMGRRVRVLVDARRKPGGGWSLAVSRARLQGRRRAESCELWWAAVERLSDAEPGDPAVRPPARAGHADQQPAAQARVGTRIRGRGRDLRRQRGHVYPRRRDRPMGDDGLEPDGEQRQPRPHVRSHERLAQCLRWWTRAGRPPAVRRVAGRRVHVVAARAGAGPDGRFSLAGDAARAATLPDGAERLGKRHALVRPARSELTISCSRAPSRTI